MPDPAVALTDQFLSWVAEGGRTYGEVMDAWRTSCPRLTIWEDALSDGLVRIAGEAGRTREQARVTLTARGRARLDGQSEPVHATRAAPKAARVDA